MVCIYIFQNRMSRLVPEGRDAANRLASGSLNFQGSRISLLFCLLMFNYLRSRNLEEGNIIHIFFSSVIIQIGQNLTRIFKHIYKSYFNYFFLTYLLTLPLILFNISV